MSIGSDRKCICAHIRHSHTGCLTFNINQEKVHSSEIAERLDVRGGRAEWLFESDYLNYYYYYYCLSLFKNSLK